MRRIPGLLALPLSAGLMFAQSTGTPVQSPTQTPSQNQMDRSTPGSGQTWTGILVSSECSSASMPRTSATSAMNQSTGSAMNRTTPQDRMRSSSDMSQGTTTGRGTPTDRMTQRTTPLDRSASDMDRGTATDRANQSASMNRDRARDVNQNPGSTDQQLERTRSMDQTGTADRRGTPTDTQSASNPQSSSQEMSRRTGQDMSTHTGEMNTNESGNWDRACFISTRTTSFQFQAPDGRVLQIDSAGNQQIKSMLDSTSRVSNKNKIFRARITGTVDGDTLHITNIVM